MGKPVGWKRIWLQMDEPEISWCQDKIHDTDVEYVAVSEIREAVERVRTKAKKASADLRAEHPNDPMADVSAESLDGVATEVLNALLHELLEGES